MTFQLQDINKINGILQMSESDVAATITGDMLYIDKSTLNPVLKAGYPSAATFETIRTHNLYNKTDNTDLVIDALGTGKILINTSQMGGVLITSTADTAFPLVVTNPLNSRSNIIGVFNTTGEQRPTFGGHVGTLNAWAPIWINPSGNFDAPVIIGDFTKALAQTVADCKLFVEGNITTRSTITLGLNTGNSFRHQLDYSTPTAAHSHNLKESSGDIAHLQQLSLAFNRVVSSSYNIVGTGLTIISMTHCKGSVAMKPYATGDAVLRLVGFSDGIDSFPIQIIDVISNAILSTFNMPTVVGYNTYSHVFDTNTLNNSAFVIGIRASASGAPVATQFQIKSSCLSFGIGA